MNRVTSFFITIALSLLLSSLAIAGKSVSETLKVQPNGTVLISLERGSVKVSTWAKNQVSVEGELDDAIEEFVFKTDGDETVIMVENKHRYYDKYWSSGSSDLVIRVPSGSQVTGQGVSSDFQVDGVEGGLKIGTVSGEIEVDSSSDNITLETVSGNIDINDSWGKMKLSSVSGDIDADGKALFFDAQTVSGDIDGVIGKTELIDVNSVSGDIDLVFEMSRDARLDAETVSGDLNFTFNNKNLDADFEVDTGPGGDIDNALSNSKAEKSFIGSEKIRFKLGSGSANIDISTMSGSVSLKK